MDSLSTALATTIGINALILSVFAIAIKHILEDIKHRIVRLENLMFQNSHVDPDSLP